MVFARFALVRTLIVLNVVVYLAWNFAPSWQDFMVRNFLVSWDSLIEGRYWTLLGSVFSHASFLHLFLNMFVLNSFGPIVVGVLRSRRFLVFYLLAGAVASFSHALVSYLLLGDPALPALGASGAISGLVLLFSFLFPRQKILLFGLIPLPAMVGAALFVGLDVWGLVAQARGGGLPIGYGAHLGGAAAGLLYYFLFFRRRWVRGEY